MALYSLFLKKVDLASFDTQITSFRNNSMDWDLLCIGYLKSNSGSNIPVFLTKKDATKVWFLPFVCIVYEFNYKEIEANYLADILNDKTKGKKLFLVRERFGNISIYIEKDPT